MVEKGLRVLLVFAAVCASAQRPLTQAEERGRQVYERGASPSGSPLTATLNADAQVPGSVLPCSNCHGHEGHGRPESGIFPSNITWTELSKPYAPANPDGRVHPPYTERLLRRAITMGIDPAGNSLNPAMPRFQLSLADCSDLIAYMKRLGDTIDPGLTETAVRLGVLLPPGAENGQAGNVFREAVFDYFARVNAEGGIFGRRVELTFRELPQSQANRPGAVLDFLGEQGTFAILGDFSDAESGMADVMRDTGTPAIAVLAPFPQTAAPLNKFVFYLEGGVKQEAQALLDFASEQFPAKDTPIAIGGYDREASRETAKWIQERLIESGRRHVVMMEDAQVSRSRILFWLKSELPSLRLASIENGDAVILIPGSLIRGPLKVASSLQKGRILVAFGMATIREESDTAIRAVWDKTTASAALLAGALRIAGRDVSRATLVEALESFRGVETNLPAPVSFGPSRHIGASIVRIVMFDPVSRKFTIIPFRDEPR